MPKLKTSHWIIISVIVIVIILIVYKYNQNTKQAQADANIASLQQQINASGGGQTSQVASIINSLFPFFQTGIQAGTQPKGA